jgi:hypothetical protein
MGIICGVTPFKKKKKTKRKKEKRRKGKEMWLGQNLDGNIVCLLTRRLYTSLHSLLKYDLIIYISSP